MKISSAYSTQNDIDHVLRLGGNTDRQRERVVAAFEKQKTTAEIAEILKTLYHGGNGDRKSTRLNSSHRSQSRMPSSA